MLGPLRKESTLRKVKIEPSIYSPFSEYLPTVLGLGCPGKNRRSCFSFYKVEEEKDNELDVKKAHLSPLCGFWASWKDLR